MQAIPHNHVSSQGGCWISTGGLPSHFFRNWFRRHFYQYAGIRYVASDNSTPVRLCKQPTGELGNLHTLASMGAKTVFLCPAGRVDIPNTSEACYFEPTNNQLSYEATESLDQVLQREYGSVSPRTLVHVCVCVFMCALEV
jgi:hypothetical protein